VFSYISPQTGTHLQQIIHRQKISDTYFIEAKLDNVRKFERIKEALIIFELEDELLIKYKKE